MAAFTVRALSAYAQECMRLLISAFAICMLLQYQSACLLASMLCLTPPERLHGHGENKRAVHSGDVLRSSCAAGSVMELRQAMLFAASLNTRTPLRGRALHTTARVGAGSGFVYCCQHAGGEHEPIISTSGHQLVPSIMEDHDVMSSQSHRSRSWDPVFYR